MFIILLRNFRNTLIFQIIWKKVWCNSKEFSVSILTCIFTHYWETTSFPYMFSTIYKIWFFSVTFLFIFFGIYRACFADFWMINSATWIKIMQKQLHHKNWNKLSTTTAPTFTRPFLASAYLNMVMVPLNCPKAIKLFDSWIWMLTTGICLF